MKLKKLLPLAGMTGVAAIVAPLVTSCAQKGTTIKWSTDDYVEGELPFDVGEYTGEKSFDSSKEATQAYLKDMETDKTIFSKEIINSVVTATYFESGTIGYIKDISVRTDEIDVDECTVSYHIDETVKLRITATITSTYNIEYEAKKLPVRISVSEEAETAGVCTLIPYLWEIEGTTDYLNKLIELSNDKSWSYSIYQADSDGYVIKQEVDYSNVLDSTLIDDLALLPSEVIGSSFVSTYFYLGE